MTIHIPTLKKLPDAAKALLPVINKATVVALHGEMGAGKTTLIKALCEALGVVETVTSPTFSVLNEYHDNKNRPVYHFDCYRLEKPEEIYDLGYEEYFYGGHLCLIEWPEKILPLLPPDTLHLHIHITRNGQRTVTC